MITKRKKEGKKNMLKMIIDALLIAAIGAAVFECGRLSAYYDIADEAKAKYLWLKQ